MIAPYVEKDPTKFCTYEEFTCGVATLKEFSLLRAESVKGQLDGTVASTSEAQKLNNDGFIDADGLTIFDMGSMNNGMGRGGKDNSGKNNEDIPDMSGMQGIPGMPDIPDMAGRPSGSESATEILLGVSAGVLLSGLFFAGFYKRRRTIKGKKLNHVT